MKYFNNSTLLLFTGRDEELGPPRSVNIKTTPTEARAMFTFPFINLFMHVNIFLILFTSKLLKKIKH